MSEQKKFRHIVLEDVAKTEKFSPPGQKIEPQLLPQRDRKTHAECLLSHLDQVRVEAERTSRSGGKSG